MRLGQEWPDYRFLLRFAEYFRDNCRGGRTRAGRPRPLASPPGRMRQRHGPEVLPGLPGSIPSLAVWGFVLLLLAPAPRAAGAAPPERRVVKILRTTDKAQANVYVPRVFEVLHANPYEVSRFVEDAVMTEGGLIATYANPAAGASSGLILVVVPEYQLEEIENVIVELDREDVTTVDGTHYDFVNLRHRSVVDNLGRNAEGALGGETPGFVEALLSFGGPDTAISVDPKTNSLLITGAPSGVDSVLQALIDYDVPRDQILMSVTVYETEVTNDKTLGLDFQAWKNGPGQDLFAINRWRYVYDIDDVQVRGVESSVGWKVDYTAEFFDYLVVKKKARVMTQLKGSVINGFPARFTEYDEILYYPVDPLEADREANVVTVPVEDPEQFSPGTLDTLQDAEFVSDPQRTRGSSKQTREPIFPGRPDLQERFPIGIRLEVTPLISRNNIDLKIQTWLTSLLAYDDQGVPQLSARQITADVRATDGQTVILGGMKRTRDVHHTRKVPVLGSIPLIGFLFGGEIGGRQNTNVFAAITPALIDPGVMPDEDRETIEQVEGRKALEVPRDRYFFEQYLVNPN